MRWSVFILVAIAVVIAGCEDPVGATVATPDATSSVPDNGNKTDIVGSLPQEVTNTTPDSSGTDDTSDGVTDIGPPKCVPGSPPPPCDIADGQQIFCDWFMEGAPPVYLFWDSDECQWIGAQSRADPVVFTITSHDPMIGLADGDCYP